MFKNPSWINLCSTIKGDKRMLQLVNLKKQLIQVINNSELPIDAVYLVYQDLGNEINNLFQKEMLEEEQAEHEAQSTQKIENNENEIKGEKK